METEKAQITTAILTNKNKVRHITIPYFKTFYRIFVIKTVWYWHTIRHVDQ